MQEKKDRRPRDLFRPEADVQAEITPRWVRVEYNGEFLADSRDTLLVREKGRTPGYYFPREDVRFDLLEESDKVIKDPNKGKTIHWHIKVGKREAPNAAFAHPEPESDWPELGSYVSFAWDEMDAWYEEEEQIFVHPRDPYKRVDVLPSSRHVRIEVDGTVLADSHRPWLLFETWLPTRYYLPPEDVKTELLRRSDNHTSCPYKGNAIHYSVEINGQEYKDLAWIYNDPLLEANGIKGMIAFYNERVDLFVDGQLQEQPQTPWS
ncbi:MAG: DUF427 domain-containing protein [Anaerolineales bacterium]